MRTRCCTGSAARACTSAGIAAAAGLVALDTMRRPASPTTTGGRVRWRRACARDPGRRGCEPEVIETNIVLADVSGTGLCRRRSSSGCWRSAAWSGLRARHEPRIRLVTHRLIGDAEVERAVAIVGRSWSGTRRRSTCRSLGYDWEAECSQAYVDEDETRDEAEASHRRTRLA